MDQPTASEIIGLVQANVITLDEARYMLAGYLPPAPTNNASPVVALPAEPTEPDSRDIEIKAKADRFRWERAKIIDLVMNNQSVSAFAFRQNFRNIYKDVEDKIRRDPQTDLTEYQNLLRFDMEPVRELIVRELIVRELALEELSIMADKRHEDEMLAIGQKKTEGTDNG